MGNLILIINLLFFILFFISMIKLTSIYLLFYSYLFKHYVCHFPTFILKRLTNIYINIL